MDSPTDRDILHALRNNSGPEEAFRMLLRAYHERLYWHVRRMVVYHDDAHDVMQDVWIRVWRALPRFREEAALYTWLYRIASNESLSHIKKQKRQREHEQQHVQELAARGLHSDPYFDGDDAQKALMQAVESLPEKQRLVFNLKYFDDLKYEEIATITETSVGALKASYHHAVKKVEEHLRQALNQIT